MLQICEREDPAYTVLHQNATFTAKPKALKWKAAPTFAMDFRADAIGPSRRPVRVPVGSHQRVCRSRSTDVRPCTGSTSRSAPARALGLVGESGCGKSVTWLAALGLLPGSAAVGGSVTAGWAGALGARPAVLDRVRGGRVAMIFQDPASALNPVHRIGRQVAEAVRAASRPVRRRRHGGGAAPARSGRHPRRARPHDAYPHEMSGGQNQRVMIADGAGRASPSCWSPTSRPRRST